jgi:hypothetical protein
MEKVQMGRVAFALPLPLETTPRTCAPLCSCGRTQQ